MSLTTRFPSHIGVRQVTAHSWCLSRLQRLCPSFHCDTCIFGLCCLHTIANSVSFVANDSLLSSCRGLETSSWTEQLSPKLKKCRSYNFNFEQLAYATLVTSAFWTN